jgi:branched-chain amino acid transport system ATP-binding protein
LLSVENLVVKYGFFRALDGLSVNVEEGQVVGVVGVNGAGKSTLMNSISGITRPESGKIIFEGKDITKTPPHKIVDLGVVQCPEGRRLFPEMTTKENLQVGSATKRAKSKRDAGFDLVYRLFPRLQERENQLCRTLSGGEQQMVAVARSLMAQPKILMMDEPSLGLAPIVIQEIFKVVEELKKLGLTILLVEQNVMHCLQIADYAYVLETGQLVMEGKGKDLLADPNFKNAYLGVATDEDGADGCGP